MKMPTMNKKEFRKLVKDVCSAWEYKYPKIKFLEYEHMNTILGMAFPKNRKYNEKYLERDLIVINEITLFYPFDKIIQIIYHELAHLITGKGDEDYEFILFCKINNIPLTGEWEEVI